LEEFLTPTIASAARGEAPLFNQTPGLTRRGWQFVLFGNKVDILEQTRRQFDPAGRLLNAYFREMLGSAAATRRK